MCIMSPKRKTCPPHPSGKKNLTSFCDTDFGNAGFPPQPSRSDGRISRGG